MPKIKGKSFNHSVYILLIAFSFVLLIGLNFEISNATLLSDLMWDQGIENQDIEETLKSENITTEDKNGTLIIDKNNRTLNPN